MGDPRTYTFFWYHIPAYIMIGLLIWFGFLHYRFFPYKYEELDMEQQYFYLSGIRKGSIPPYNITPDQAFELKALTNAVEWYYESSAWNRRKNLIPPIVGILEIIIYYLYHTL